MTEFFQSLHKGGAPRWAIWALWIAALPARVLLIVLFKEGTPMHDFAAINDHDPY